MRSNDLKVHTPWLPQVFKPTNYLVSYTTDLFVLSKQPVLFPGNSVKDYLRYHGSFLEDFLLQEIPVAVLQKILKRKTSSRESGVFSDTEIWNNFDVHTVIGYEVASVVGKAISKLKVQKQKLEQ